jgi:AcrR family transcriptional regulator
MKTKKSEILKEAAYVFATKGYDGASLAQIGAAVGIQKSSLFAHIKSKDELYRAVVEQFVLKQQDPSEKFESGCCSLSDFIKIYIEGVVKTMLTLKALFDNRELKSIDYLSFILQACKKHQDCADRMVYINEKEINLWKLIIENAKKSGEIRANVDADFTAKMFRYSFSGMSYLFSFQDGVTNEELENVFYKFYETLKE